MAKAKQPAKGKFKARAPAIVAQRNGKASRTPRKTNMTNVFEADDDDQVISRRGHALDSVESYEYHVDQIDDEDDEEIDSDEAFDESDEERFEHFKFLGSTKPSEKKSAKSRKGGDGEGEINLNEDDSGQDDGEEDDEEKEEEEEEEEEEEDEDGNGFMDVSEMFDDEGASSREAAPKKEDDKKIKFAGLIPESDEEEDEFAAIDDDTDEDEADSDEGGEDEDESFDKTEELESFIGSLEKKRKRDADDAVKEKKRRGPIKERTEAYTESEFNLTARGSASATGAKKKLELQDLVKTLQDETGLSGLKKNLQALESAGGKGTAETLAAPLPKRIQDRLNRQAAYQETKKEVAKWQPIVKANREADHLAFPMNDARPTQITSAGLANKFEATTDLEKQIRTTLEDAGMKEKNLKDFEELAMNKLSIEEVEARRKQLRMMRELMFREEIKAKRIAKIKSKTYRKIKKKEKEKNSLMTEQLMDLDPELAGEERLKAEADRAAERMTLKHKNTGKWAKQMLKHGQHDEGSRQAIMEQLQRGEDLKRKIQGIGSDEKLSDEEGAVNYSDIEDGDVEAVRRRAATELDWLEESLQEEEGEGGKKKGLLAMKFMQDAAKRQREENRAMLSELKDGLESEASSEEDEQGGQSKSKNTKERKRKEKEMNGLFTLVGNNPGRMVFGLGAKHSQNGKLPEQDKSTEEPLLALNDSGQVKKVAVSAAHNTRMSGPVSINGPSKAPSTKQQDTAQEEESNPWLQADTSRVVTQSKKQNKGVGKASDAKSDKLVSKLKKQKWLAGERDEEDIEIDLGNALTLAEATRAAKTKKKAKQNSSDAAVADTEDRDDGQDEDSDLDDVADKQPKMVHAKNALAFSQRELVARAFANDNVVEEFEEEKRQAMEEDAPKEVDLTLPGWGAWSGKGIVDKKNVVVKKPLPGEGVEASKRQDAKLKHVIINEKRVKKATKYQITTLPYPFQTREQYENSLRAPVGKEWNTTATFQKMVLPRVTTKLGKVIDPLTAPFQ
ncbi:Utp14 protein-domain-containing protein [Jimgerdemannia flammicorona]|uniref:Utp14 protein-domain-containing protein n=1 Tax=Jimgerdemannia flammicorona TaxID=994334 RepID=A0A433DA06_9FUNG|nr:Utp14 protein-domain-containing protein [Jimgerdemannia flammicorona]